MAAAKKKADLIEEAEAAGVDVPADATVPEIKEALAEAEAVDVDAPLPGTPVDAGLYEAPVGVPNPDPGDVVAAAQAAAVDDEGDA